MNANEMPDGRDMDAPAAERTSGCKVVGGFPYLHMCCPDCTRNKLNDLVKDCGTTTSDLLQVSE